MTKNLTYYLICDSKVEKGLLWYVNDTFLQINGGATARLKGKKKKKEKIMYKLVHGNAIDYSEGFSYCQGLYKRQGRARMRG